MLSERQSKLHVMRLSISPAASQVTKEFPSHETCPGSQEKHSPAPPESRQSKVQDSMVSVLPSALQETRSFPSQRTVPGSHSRQTGSSPSARLRQFG